MIWTLAVLLVADLGTPTTTVADDVDKVVVVAASRRAEPRAASRIEGEALDSSRGKNLADVVATVPGVSVLRSGATAKPIVRGLSGARVLVLQDGVRHESQDWGIDHGTEIDPFAAGRITVIKGAAGVRYGPDAIAGVLVVDPPPLRTEPGIGAELQLVGATNGRRGTVAGRVEAAPSWIDGLSLRLEGNFAKGRALQTPNYPLDNTGSVEWNAGAAARYIRDALTLQLSFSHHDTNIGVCSCVKNESVDDFFSQQRRAEPLDADSYRAEYGIERPRQEVTHDRLIARTSYDLDGVTLEATYAFQNNRRRELDRVRSSVQGPQFDFELRTHSLDVTAEHAPLSVLEGLAGASLSLQENVYTGLPLIPNYRSFGAGVFAVERLRLGAAELVGGARYDFMQRTAFVASRSDVERRASDFHMGSVSLGLIGPLVDGVTAKLDLSSASRAPTIDEQYVDGTAPSFPVMAVGDPALGPETSWTASATLVAEADWLSAELSVFGSYIDDYITFAPDLRADGTPIFDVLIRGAFPRFRHRAVNAVLYGGEASAKVVIEPFEVELSGSVVRGRDVDNDQFLVFVPPDRGRAAVTYRPPKLGVFEDTFVRAAATFVARQARFEPLADLADPPPGYVLLGAAAGTTVDPIHVSIEIENLLDAEYRDYTSLLRYFSDEPGRQVILRIGARL